MNWTRPAIRCQQLNASQFHAPLDKWMGGKYAGVHTPAAFKYIDNAEVIKDLTNFCKTAENGPYSKYMNDFLQAVKGSGCEEVVYHEEERIQHT